MAWYVLWSGTVSHKSVLRPEIVHRSYYSRSSEWTLVESGYYLVWLLLTAMGGAGRASTKFGYRFVQETRSGLDSQVRYGKR